MCVKCKKISKIFLDLDDVCNELTVHSLHYVGCKIEDYSEYPVEVGYDIVSACNALHKSKNDWTVAEFWNALPRSVWSNTPKSLYCDELIDVCVDIIGKDNLFLATSPTKDPDCLAGKLEWIQENTPEFLHRQYVITPRKWLLANEKTLLIDDNGDNIKRFYLAGGNVIMFPRPWNCLHGMDSMSWVKFKMDKLFKDSFL
jgi:hypothetical protein